jgi:hypothetical protein
MYIPFSNLSPQARTWVYQADRKMNQDEKQLIEKKLRDFTEIWQVHGAPLEASYEIRYDQFIILAVNDTTSGCSIDSSVRVIQEAGSVTGIDFFNRNLVAFKTSEEIKLIELSLLKSAFRDGKWDERTLVFNNLVSSIREVNEGWLVPAGATWLKRYAHRTQSVE